MRLEAQDVLTCIRRQRLAVVSIFCTLLVIVGCEEEHSVSDRPVQPGRAGSSTPPKPEFIVGKRTQEIKNAGPEIRREGATVATTRITAQDPITLPGNAYVTIIGKLSILQIQQAVDLYNAEHGRYPKDYREFMDEIIKANNIALPVLPNYQKYGYDEKEHKLVILEYEDLKNQPLGR